MKYSIIIPTFNNKILLNNTLEVLNSQKTSKKYEVIVVDYGSSDNTYEYIKETPKNYNFKYFYLNRCEKSSRARTRNHGWRNHNFY